MLFSFGSYIRQFLLRFGFLEGLSHYLTLNDHLVKGYLKQKFRKELVDAVNIKGLLTATIEPLKDESIVYDALDSIAFKFVSGKSLEEGIQPQTKREEKREQLLSQKPGEYSWAAGAGRAMEERLKGDVEHLISKRGLAEPDSVETMAYDLLFNTRALNREEKSVFDKVHSDMTRMLSKNILNVFLNEKTDFLRKQEHKAPYEERDVEDTEEEDEPQTPEKTEKTHPLWLQDLDVDVDVGAIRDYVAGQGKIWEMLFNSIVKVDKDNKPFTMTQKQIIDEIEKETGKEISTGKMSEYRKQLLDKIHAKFFSSALRKERIVLKSLSEMSDTDSSEFINFIKEKNEKPHIQDALIKMVEELTSGQGLTEIAEKHGINLSNLKKYNREKLKPYFEEWQKEKETKTAGYLLKQAFIEEGYFMQDVFAEAIRSAKDVMAAKMTQQEVQKQLDYEKSITDIPIPHEEHELPKGGPNPDMNELDKVFGLLDGKVNKAQAQIYRFVLNHKPPRFTITVGFTCDYDWEDVAMKKKSPKLDAMGDKWVEDDPHFAWEYFSVKFFKPGESEGIYATYMGGTRVEFEYKLMQKLTAEGEPSGSADSFFKLTYMKKNGSKEVRISDGVEPNTNQGFKDFIDKYMLGILKRGIPIEGKRPEEEMYSVNYKNVKTGEKINGSHEFIRKYYGLGVSTSGHKKQVEEIKEFKEKVEHFLYGGPAQHGKQTVEGLAKRLTNISKESDVPPADKSKIKGFIEYLKKYRKRSEWYREIPMDDLIHDKDIAEMKIFIKDYDTNLHKKHKEEIKDIF